MPDDELLTLAESGKLSDPRVLEAQVDRMLADPRAAGFAANFAGQWLETRNLDVVKPDPDKFKEWDPELREAMKTETTMFFDRAARDLGERFEAIPFINERLEPYGIAGSRGRVPQVALTTIAAGGVEPCGVLTARVSDAHVDLIRGK